VYERVVEGRPLEEAHLVDRARRGDIAAYDQLVLAYQDLALRTAYLFSEDRAEAEDAAQEGFIKAFLALPRFRPGAAFRPWLLRIVANEARNRRRSGGRRTGLALRLAEDRRDGDAAPSPERAVLDQETSGELLAALARLRPDDRLVIGCRYFLELDEAEMAETLGLRRGTVKSRLSRAMARLRQEFPADMPGWTDHG
jgi:RNA polymerase sigma-70 factor (ECF subfamily)